MEKPTGIWSQVELAGHICRTYEPAAPSPHNYTVICLHCSEAASLRSYPAFGREFDRYGLRVIEPVTGRSWWTDRIWPEFDPAISAEAYVLETHVVPFIAERWNASPPRLGLLGISMGGQGGTSDGLQIPQCFSHRGRDCAGHRFSKADRRRGRSGPGVNVSRCRRGPARTPPSCTFTRSTGRGISSYAAIQPTCGGTIRRSGCG